MNKDLYNKSNTYMIGQINNVLEAYQEPAAEELTDELSFEFLGVSYIPGSFHEQENGIIYVKTLQVPSADEHSFNVSEDFLKKYFLKCLHYYVENMMTD